HHEFTIGQLSRFDEVLTAVPELPDDVVVHAANSAAALAHVGARRQVLRAGIAMYGISPGSGVDDLVGDLRPALSLTAKVSFVKRVRAGTAISYGLRHTFERDTTVATIPIGYADGVPRRLSAVGGRVLVGGRRCPIVGVVTMDQLMVDVGDAHVEVGDDVVLIGRQGDEVVRAEDWATALDTIGYEIVCGISPRVPRVHVGGPGASSAESA
ncbi:MAG: alanine racemase, partial [Actinomycetota bacterium]